MGKFSKVRLFRFFSVFLSIEVRVFYFRGRGRVLFGTGVFDRLIEKEIDIER